MTSSDPLLLDEPAAEHWKLWFGGLPAGADVVLLALVGPRTAHIRRAPAGDLDAYLAAAHRLLAEAPEANLFVGCCPQQLGEGREKGTAATVASLPGLWLDVDTDIQPEAHAASGLPGHAEGLALAESICAELELSPTIIETGGGWHIWIPAETPMDPDEGTKLMAGWSRHVEAAFVRAGVTPDTAPLQPAAMLRVPGSMRRKPRLPANRVELRRVGERNDMSTLAGRLPPPPRRPVHQQEGEPSPFRRFAQRVAPAELMPLLGARMIGENSAGTQFWRLQPTSSAYSVVTYPADADGTPGRALVVGATLAGVWSAPENPVSIRHTIDSTGLVSALCGGDRKLLRRVLAACGDGDSIAPLEALFAPVREAGNARALTPSDVAAAFPPGRSSAGAVVVTGTRRPTGKPAAGTPTPATPAPATSTPAGGVASGADALRSALRSALGPGWKARMAGKADATQTAEPARTHDSVPSAAPATTPAPAPEPDDELPLPVWMPAGSHLEPLVAWLEARPGGAHLALDTETTGRYTNVTGFRVTQLAFGCEDGASAVIDGSDGDLVRAALNLALPGRKWWAHNARYDVDAIRSAYGIMCEGIFDTLAGMRCILPGQGVSRSLKALRPATLRAQDALKAHWEEVSGKAAADGWLPLATAVLPPDDPFLLRYVATDAVETARLVTEVATSEFATQAALEVRLDVLWRRVHYDGIRVDVVGLTAEREKIRAMVAEARERNGIDLASSSDATRAWVAERGIIIKNSKGKETISAKDWEHAVIPEGSEEAWAEFKRIRSASSNVNKIGELLRHAGQEGRIYPAILANGAVQTGRMTASEPAVQNLPAELRPFLMADPGKVLVGLDLDQVEPRIAAVLSGDPDMREAILSGDVYSAVAELIWPDPPADEEERLARRKVAKKALLAQLYGEGAQSLAWDLGVSVPEAARIGDAILSGWKKLRAWRMTAKNKGAVGKLTTWAGRPLPRPDRKSLYKSINYGVQGSAADVFKVMVIDVAPHLRDFEQARLFLPVHDELVVECLEADAEAVMAMLGEVMRMDLAGIPIGGAPSILGTRLVHA